MNDVSELSTQVILVEDLDTLFRRHDGRLVRALTVVLRVVGCVERALGTICSLRRPFGAESRGARGGGRSARFHGSQAARRRQRH